MNTPGGQTNSGTHGAGPGGFGGGGGGGGGGFGNGEGGLGDGEGGLGDGDGGLGDGEGGLGDGDGGLGDGEGGFGDGDGGFGGLFGEGEGEDFFLSVEGDLSDEDWDFLEEEEGLEVLCEGEGGDEFLAGNVSSAGTKSKTIRMLQMTFIMDFEEMIRMVTQ